MSTYTRWWRTANGHEARHVRRAHGLSWYTCARCGRTGTSRVEHPDYLARMPCDTRAA